MFSSNKCFGMEFWEFASVFVPRNGILSCFLFRRLVGMEFQEFASLFVLWNIIPSCFLLGGIFSNGIRRVCFYRIASIYGSERNSKSFLSRGTTGIRAEESNCSVYSVFSRIIFLSEIVNPNGKPKVNTQALTCEIASLNLGAKLDEFLHTVHVFQLREA